MWGRDSLGPLNAKDEITKPQNIIRSAKRINHPRSFTALIKTPWKSIINKIPKTVKFPLVTNIWTSRDLVFLDDHVISPSPSAHAPEMRVTMIPTRFVDLPRMERLTTGKIKNKIAFMNVKIEAAVAMVLNLILFI